MGEKQFTFGAVSPNVAMIKNNGEPMDIGEVVSCLNEQQDIIEELQQKYDKLCIEIANIYSKYIFMKEFSEDTNPNEAVKYVLRELMQKTKGVR